MFKLLIMCLLGVLSISDSKILSSNEIEDDADLEILGKFLYLFDQSLNFVNNLTSSNATSEKVFKIIKKVDDVYRFLMQDFYLPDEMTSKGNQKNSSGRFKREDTKSTYNNYVAPVIKKLKSVYNTVKKKVTVTVSTLIKHVFSEKVDKPAS